LYVKRSEFKFILVLRTFKFSEEVEQLLADARSGIVE